jgi:hypothetical protein
MDFGIGTSVKIVREVYRIDKFSCENKWEPFTHDREGRLLKRPRWGFVGVSADNLQSLKYTSVDHLSRATGQTPFFYINC